MFFPFNAAGEMTFKGSAVAVDRSQLILSRPICELDLSCSSFYALRNGSLGKVFLSEGEMYDEPYIEMEAFISADTQAADDCYFVRHSLHLQSQTFNVQDNISIAKLGELSVLPDLTTFGLFLNETDEAAPILTETAAHATFKEVLKLSAKLNSASSLSLCSQLADRDHAAVMTRVKVEIPSMGLPPRPQQPSLVPIVSVTSHLTHMETPVELQQTTEAIGVSRVTVRAAPQVVTSRPPRAKRSEVSSIVCTIEKRLSEDDRTFFNATWDQLKRLGWRTEWVAGTNEAYVVPLGSSKDKVQLEVKCIPALT
jgi:hypothetical protein